MGARARMGLLAAAIVTAGCTGAPARPPQPFQGPSEKTGATPMDARQTAELLLHDIASGDYDGASALFSKTLRSALPRERFAAIVREIEAKGPIGAWRHRAESELGGSRLEVFEIRRGSDPLVATVVVLSDGRIGGLQFRALASEPRPPTREAHESDFFDVATGVAGTVSVPMDAPPIAGALIVPGSGPHDRDGPIGGPRMLLWLARALARYGVATVRFDKRSFIGHKEPITFKRELVDDAIVAMKHLRAIPGMERKQFFVVGHSLGALAAAEIAVGSPPVRGLALLAPPGRPLTQVILDQLTSGGAADAALQRTILDLENGRLADGALFLGAPASYWRDLSRRDHIGAVRATGLPVLLVRGALDDQVKEVDMEMWIRGLGPGQVTAVQPEGVGHLLGHLGDTEGVAESVVEPIAAFVASLATAGP